MTVEVGGRTVTVTGPRGSLKREFKSANFAVETRGKRSLRVDTYLWRGEDWGLTAVRRFPRGSEPLAS